ncbi:hypothetical protein P168DRAFT_241674 [Aspergillus campestris IBT 28561]|uniref:INO80 complex subunit F domain-containing protein n=1 Tax=Aspergillus campestris (strain IBT 28561) TaxID=1392248 RepID=A0A2I1CUU4_ASPC2|nr:uncharacterized protein P168DRAFT_241674 [Aspergillus campestris IBT 28561]PKY01387.1 hypothetical protein P168DRAFT_241674 [Aspergillus campestris IBT 28561]
METTKAHHTSVPSSNPPSVEVAYKRKCIALKKRLSEIEAENEMMSVRNRRGWQYIQKMRLESCILLEHLAKVTGMAEEAQAGGVSSELRARAAGLMSSAAGANGIAEEKMKNGESAAGYYEDETEGSSDEQPPTPQERPLRVKRSRKSNVPNELGDDDAASATNAVEPSAVVGSSTLPRLAPAPSQDDMTSSFRVQSGSNGDKESNHNEGSDRGSQQPPEGSRVPEPEDDEGATTPMDMDMKEPKEES